MDGFKKTLAHLLSPPTPPSEIASKIDGDGVFPSLSHLHAAIGALALTRNLSAG